MTPEKKKLSGTPGVHDARETQSLGKFMARISVPLSQRMLVLAAVFCFSHVSCEECQTLDTGTWEVEGARCN